MAIAIKKIFVNRANIRKFILKSNVLAEILTGGTPSQDKTYSADYTADKACDKNTGTRSAGDGSAFPHWWKYDFGAGNNKIIQQVSILPFSNEVKDFQVQASNNNTDWTTLGTFQHGNNSNLENFYFSNIDAYRYYRLLASNNWAGSGYNSMIEIYMYSQTIKKIAGISNV